MDNNQILEHVLACVRRLEDKVEILSKKMGVEPTGKGDGEKRCLPGFNECRF